MIEITKTNICTNLSHLDIITAQKKTVRRYQYFFGTQSSDQSLKIADSILKRQFHDAIAS